MAGAGALEALLWDVDGTIAETERDGHRVAFNRAFEDFGVPWHWDEALYGELLHITGGRERLLHDMQGRAAAPVRAAEREALAKTLHAKKNALYADIVGTGVIPLREGVSKLMVECRTRGVRMGITTTTSRANVDALLRWHLGSTWAQQFAVVVCGEDVERKKPDPAVYLQALRQLGIAAWQAVAIEDSAPGVAAARAAGIPVIVTRSAYFEHLASEVALAIGPGLHTRRGWWPELPGAASAGADERAPVNLGDIEAWHGETTRASRGAAAAAAE